MNRKNLAALTCLVALGACLFGGPLVRAVPMIGDTDPQVLLDEALEMLASAEAELAAVEALFDIQSQYKDDVQGLFDETGSDFVGQALFKAKAEVLKSANQIADIEEQIAELEAIIDELEPQVTPPGTRNPPSIGDQGSGGPNFVG